MNGRLIQAAMGVTLGLMATGLILLYALRAPEGESSGIGGLLPAPYPAPELDLRNPDGGRVRLGDFRGQVVAIFFGYTSCPDVCPITLNRLGRLQTELSDEPDQLAFRILFVSVDPARDTPERLRSYAAGLPGEVLALTEEEDEVRRQAFDFGVSVAQRSVDALPEGEYLVDHTARTYLVGPNGQVSASLAPMATPDEIEETVRAVLRESR